MAVKFEGCVWLASVFVRFLWTLAPQTGYIHPDEFFQAPEITAGDILGIQTTRTWEFNETFPVRSILFPYVLTGLPFWLLKVAASEAFNISAEALLVLPRLALCAFSLMIDFSVWIICRSLRLDAASRLCVLGTSFVTLVFCCRPFSNSIEAVLFSLLLALVVCCLCRDSQVPSVHSRLRVFSIGLLVAAGVWNRPTFLAFSVTPLLGWLYNAFYRRWAYGVWTKIATNLAEDVMIMAAGFLVSCCVFIAADSFYFGYLQKGKLVLTPLNFLRYNLDPNSLRQHGLHPRFAHLVVNMPLLFGPLAIILVFVIIKLAIRRNPLQNSKAFASDYSTPENSSDDGTKAKYSMPPGTLCIVYMVLLCSAAFPVCFLSVIPHQEPRFIIPVLSPLVVLFSPLVLKSSPRKLLWISWNLIGCILFGLLHQGGVCPALVHLQNVLTSEMQSTAGQVDFHLVFYRTYMPPQHLLAWPSCGTKCKVPYSLVVHDLRGSPENGLHDKLNEIAALGTQSESDRSLKVQGFPGIGGLLCKSLCGGGSLTL